MKRALGFLLACMLLFGGFFGAVILASESGKVITIRTQDATSGWHSTRLWVVDHDNTAWTRTGHAEKPWFKRLVANPRVGLERGGERTSRNATPVHDTTIAWEVNAAFTDKYGIADRIVALSGDASKRVVIRLDRVSH